MSHQLPEILEFNKTFVEHKDYEQFRTDRFPTKQVVIVTCMDTRLTELLPKAMNLANGDAKIIKIAGATIAHPFGSVTRSIMIAVYELGAKEVLVIGHHDCGMTTADPKRVLKSARERGVSAKTIRVLEHSGINLTAWLAGFDSVIDNVKQSVSVLRNHPLLPDDVAIHGLVIDPLTGKLDVVDEQIGKLV